MQRYPVNNLVASSQNPLDDLVDWLGFLLSRDYVSQLLRDKHAMTAQAANLRSREILPHVRVAIEFIQQSLSGPRSLSYLPGYYAILNLMKVCILAGPNAHELAANRFHGAIARNPRTPQTILTDTVILQRRGAFGLFYRTLTGELLPSPQVRLQVDDFLPLIYSVGAEYEIATGKATRLAPFQIVMEEPAAGMTRARATVTPAQGNAALNHVKLLANFSSKRGTPNTFYSPTVPIGIDHASNLRRHLIYRVAPNMQVTPISAKAMQLPEEIPIALLFLYLSSLVRYQPQLLERLMSTSEWPVIAAARTHALTAFILCFWSYLHQSNSFIMPSHA